MTGCITALALVLVRGEARACGDGDEERAIRAERAHHLGEAIEIRSALRACEGAERAVDNGLALAADHASVGDFERAAEVAEAIAQRVTREPPVVAAMAEAAAWRIALGQIERAEADVRWLFLAGSEAEAVERAFEVGDALERSGQWIAAVRWYRWLLQGGTSSRAWQVQIRALTALGRAQERSGQANLAHRSREGAVQRAREGAATRRPEPGSATADSLAEARFRVAEALAARCYDVAAIRRSEPVDAPTLVWRRWVERSLTPWVRQQLSCVDEASRQLVGAIELHVPRWEVAAVAVIATMHRRMAHAAALFRYPPEVRRNPELIDAYRNIQ